MSEWNNNNAADVGTWGALGLLTQLDAKFSKAGALKMTDLKFWVTSSTPDIRAIQIATLAAQMDRFFCDPKNGLGATYESGVKQDGAVAALNKCFSTATKTVEDLADIADEKYIFLS